MDLKITPSGQTIVKPTALGPVANTDTKLLIYGLFQKGRVLAQDGVTPSAMPLPLKQTSLLSNRRTAILVPKSRIRSEHSTRRPAVNVP